jgi:hypothetical protein
MDCPLLGNSAQTCGGISGGEGSLGLYRSTMAALLVAEFMLKMGLLSQFQVVDHMVTGLTQEQYNNN